MHSHNTKNTALLNPPARVNLCREPRGTRRLNCELSVILIVVGYDITGFSRQHSAEALIVTLYGIHPVVLAIQFSSKNSQSERVFREALATKTAVEATDTDWFRLAREVADRKFGRSPATEQKDRARRMRFLQYRGFNFDQIKYALSATDAEDF